MPFAVAVLNIALILHRVATLFNVTKKNKNHEELQREIIMIWILKHIYIIVSNHSIFSHNVQERFCCSFFTSVLNHWKSSNVIPQKYFEKRFFPLLKLWIYMNDIVHNIIRRKNDDLFGMRLFPRMFVDGNSTFSQLIHQNGNLFCCWSCINGFYEILYNTMLVNFQIVFVFVFRIYIYIFYFFSSFLF